MRGQISWPAVVFCTALAVGASGQTPQPFPRPAREPSAGQPSPPPLTNERSTQGVKVLPPQPATAVPGEADVPNEQTLGFVIYPGAQFIASYDAGKGQRFYLFGTSADFAQVVAYYRTALKQRGELVFETPAIHMFEVGRFREETMAFPPGVTVKDYSPAGYLNPKRGAEPASYKTIIQFVPPPVVGGPLK